jgi:hypothetical protein
MDPEIVYQSLSGTTSADPLSHIEGDPVGTIAESYGTLVHWLFAGMLIVVLRTAVVASGMVESTDAP